MLVHECKVAWYYPQNKKDKKQDKPVKPVLDAKKKDEKKKSTRPIAIGVRLEFTDRHADLKEDQIVEESCKEGQASTLRKAHGTIIIWTKHKKRENGKIVLDKDGKPVEYDTYSVQLPSCPIRDKLDNTYKENKHEQVRTTAQKERSIGEREFQRVYPALASFLPIICDCWLEHEAEMEEKYGEKVAA